VDEPELDAAFRAELGRALEGTGLTGQNLDPAWSNGDFPEIHVPGPEGARYLVGMSRVPGVSPMTMRAPLVTSLWASYNSEADEEEQAVAVLSLELAGDPGACDPRLLAAVTVFAVVRDAVARFDAGTLASPKVKEANGW
jgi:hypothetical protein